MMMKNKMNQIIIKHIKKTKQNKNIKKTNKYYNDDDEEEEDGDIFYIQPKKKERYK